MSTIFEMYVIEGTNDKAKKKDIEDNLRDSYRGIIERATKSTLTNFAELKKHCTATPQFDYDIKKKVCYVNIISFENYAYTRQNKSKDVQIELTNKFISDVKSFKESLQKVLTNFKLSIYVDGFKNIDAYKNSVISDINNGNKLPSNTFDIIAIIDKKETKAANPGNSEESLDMFKRLLKEFNKFINHPFKMSSRSFYGAHVAGICKVCDISSEKLNEKVSKNIKSFGAKMPKNEKVASELGKCIILESFNNEEILYSIDKKKMYYVNYNTGESGLFYNSYPHTDKKFEKAVAENSKAEIKGLFRMLAEENKYNIFD
ncbi:MAG: hypothetical protein IKR19_08415 [Acholeplasmatales bacterium]|nr:hypothetical protein [Acholeplasmatales bacterium]